MKDPDIIVDRAELKEPIPVGLDKLEKVIFSN
jgi:hypothetical protein